MSSPRCIIISEECLVVAGLRAFLKESGLFSSIEHEYSLQNIVNNHTNSEIVLFIDYRLIPDPKAYTLERLHQKNKNCSLVAIHSKELDPEMQPYFKQVIITKNDEKDIQLKIHDLLSQFEHGKINESKDLSEREKEILKYVASGKTNKEISDLLNISTHTVITHRKNITAKLGIKTIAGLTVYAIINGIISTDEVS